MKLVFTIASLGAGGAERMLTELAAHFAQRGHEVVVATFCTPDAVDFYTLPSAVRRVHMGNPAPSRSALGKLAANLERIRCLRRLLKAECPDSVLSFMDTMNVTTILAAAGLRMRVVVAERSDPASNMMVPKMWRIGRRLTYRFADLVTAQTKGAADWLRAHCGGNVCVIPNALRELPPPTVPRETLVLSVGRLDANKGFDVVVDAFARVHQRFPAWRLAIVGDGPLRDTLAAQARLSGIESKVQWVGTTRQIEGWYARAGMLVQGSRLEGFPNVLLEGMGMGLAVVSTDCRSGPADLVQSGANGVLVPVDDASAMAEAMARLMGNESECQRLGGMALEVRHRYAPQVVLPLWEKALATSNAPKPLRTEGAGNASGSAAPRP